MTLQEKWLWVAKSFLGVKEATGNNDGPLVNFFQISCADLMTLGGNAIGEADLLGSPWCAEFATVTAFIAATLLGVELKIPVHCSSAWLYDWAKNNGKLVPAVAGTLGLLRGGPSGHQHTFQVITVDTANGIVHTLDGNEQNCVEYAQHPIDQCDFVSLA